MKEILTIQDIISLENKNIIDYLVKAFHRMPTDIQYPSNLASIVVIENATDLIKEDRTQLHYSYIPSISDIKECIEIVEHDEKLQITEVVLILDYTTNEAISLVIPDNLISHEKVLKTLFKTP